MAWDAMYAISKVNSASGAPLQRELSEAAGAISVRGDWN